MPRAFPAALALAATLLATPAQAATFRINWSGSFGYTMTGSFAFDDSLLGSSAISQTSLSALSIQVFLNGALQGAWDYFANGLSPNMTLNFNFNPSAGAFLIGDPSDTPNGQAWNYQSEGDNCPASGVGFVSGNAGEGVCFGGNVVSGVSYDEAPSTLTATREITLTRAPEPATIGLLGVGLAGLAAFRRRRLPRARVPAL